jgi:hypothetical protein
MLPIVIFENQVSYSTIFVTLKGFGLATTESTLVNQVWQVLLHHVLNLLDGSVEALFGGASDAQIQRRVLHSQ